MPGREDLIQQNRAAVRARVESAGEQEATGGEKPVYSSHRSLLGGNLDVASALESIEFAVKGPLGDGALRNSVAYIRYWSRPGSKATAETSSQTVDATQLNPLLDPQSQLYNQIADNLNLNFDFPKDYDPTAAYTGSYEDLRSTDWYSPSNATFTDEDGNLVKTENQVVFSVADTNRQKALAQEIPTTKTNTGAVNTNVVGSSPQVDTGTTSSSASRQSGVGQLKPANPNGFVNTISKIGRSVLGLPPSQIGYQGAAGAAQGGKAPLASGGTLAKGMWQFLFNPSELEIDAGPEFKAAETWGVSDKGNSGQPLNWSHNKNTQLKFNSVLLNGYVFGRKVEELEQGIFELFMARDGEGQAGPPILEFVWGKRVFGPCVIKDISVKEKMWDEGMVVNAELSFTLEQIPEWTINDGYVDIARPGKIPMVYDSTEDNGGKVGAGSTAPPSPSGGGSPDQKSKDPNQPQTGSPEDIFKQCASIRSDQNYLQKFITDFSSKLEGYGGLEYGPFGILKSDTTSVFLENLRKYKIVFNKYRSNSIYKSQMREGVLGVKCVDTSSIEYNWRNSGNAEVRIKDKTANSALVVCLKNIKSIVDKEFNNRKCGNLAAPTGQQQGPGF